MKIYKYIHFTFDDYETRYSITNGETNLSGFKTFKEAQDYLNENLK